MNDDFLDQIHEQPRSEFAAQLYERISNPMQTQLQRNPWRYAAASLGILAVLALFLALSPSALAFAQGILRRVGGYIFVMSGEPIEVRNTHGPLSVWKTLGGVAIHNDGNVPSTGDPRQASAMAGFDVLSPSYLPEGYRAMSGWYVFSEDNGMAVTRGFSGQAYDFLIVNEWKVANAAQRYARPSIVSVTVRGHPGVWLPAAPAGGPGQKRALVWEENGITYSLITDALPLEEMLKVAESLGK